MFFKYDLDKFDPLGTKKIQETIATMTKPSRDWAAIVNPHSKIQDEIAALYKNNPLTRAHANLVAMTDPSYSKAYAHMADMQKSIALTKTQANIAALANPYSKIQDEIATLYKNNPLTRAHANLVAMTDLSYSKAYTNMADFQKSIALTKAQANIAAMADPYGIAKTREALSKQAFSIAHNESLGLHSDVKRLIAATTLNPELNAKIRNFNQTVLNLSLLTGQNSKQNSKSTQDYLETIENFNEKYSQDLNIDEVTVQALDLVIQDQDTSNLVSELTHIGVFDTSNGSILYEYAGTLPEEKRGHFLNVIFVILMFVYQPVVDTFEPLKQHREQVTNIINNIEGKAVVTKDCDLRNTPNGLPIGIILSQGSIIQVYKSKDNANKWSKIKYNKDGQDITGYLKVSEFRVLNNPD